MPWKVGESLYTIFGTKDDSHPAIEAHLKALRGETCEVKIQMASPLLLSVRPLTDDDGAVIGCIGAMIAL